MKRNKPSTPKIVFPGHKRRYHLFLKLRPRPKYKQPKPVYHVFLSFRGKDVRNTLVDHLYRALTSAGLIVFLDNVELKKGHIIWKSLEKAIKSSAICIPVFSKGYAGSPWCLREASAMLRAPGLTIPLFYRMEPTHVRRPLKETSPYREPLLGYESNSKRYRRREVKEWKKTLHALGNRSGFSTIATNGMEGELVGQVVTEVIRKCDRMPLEVAKHPVGMEKLKRPLISKLELSRKLGIWGMTGSGKTTAAKYLYNKIHGCFQFACFLENVSANAVGPTGLPHLQKQILTEFVDYDGEVPNVSKGIALFRERLRNLRLLLFLDDVNTVEQLEALAGDWLGTDCRIVITSTDRHILNVSCHCIHEMTRLGHNNGLELFKWYASQSPGSAFFIERDEIKQLACGIVEACEGHPYALVKMGYTLSGKTDEKLWTEASHNIRRNEDINRKLSPTYMALPDVHKDIFRDIACFFNGEHKHLPILFWKSLPELSDMVVTAVDDLVNKALLRIDDGVFHMHYLYREMGRLFAETEEKPTVLWNAASLRISLFLKEFSRVQLNESSPLRLQVFCTDHLRYLHLENQTIDLAMLPTSLIFAIFIWRIRQLI